MKNDNSDFKKFLPKGIVPLPSMEPIYELAMLYARSGQPIVIAGPTGVGKDHVAEFIHNVHPGKEKPLKRTNCANFGGSDDRIAEIHIFGIVEKAITNIAPRKGLLQEANGGTLFLDEVHHLPHEVRAKLLRFLQDASFTPVGKDEEVSANVRIIVATNHSPLEEALAPIDFYSRLFKHHIAIPPLSEWSERQKDIKKLVENLAEDREIAPLAMRLLENSKWDKNIRDIERVIDNACMFADAFNVEALNLESILAALFSLERGRFPSKEYILSKISELSLKDFCMMTGTNPASDFDSMPEKNKEEVLCTAASDLLNFIERYISVEHYKSGFSTPENLTANLKLEIPDDLYKELIEKFARSDTGPTDASDVKAAQECLAMFYYKTENGYSWEKMKSLSSQSSIDLPSEARYRRLFKDKQNKGKAVFRNNALLDVEEHIKGHIRSRNMVPIEAGAFEMGSNHTKDAQDDDAKPQHSVYVDKFFMDKFVVSNQDYMKFVIANPDWDIEGKLAKQYCDSDYLRHWKGKTNDYQEEKKDYPVIYVSWFAAMAYAHWKNKRLPTEAEWEKAARSGLKGKRFPWGDNIDKEKANYRAKDSKIALEPVGNYAPNKYGLYDMVGNAWEWCIDDYISDFYANSPPENPIAMKENKNLESLKKEQSIESLLKVFENVQHDSSAVTRGGGFADWFSTLSVAQRNANSRKLCNMSLSLRCIREDEELKNSD